MQVCPSCGSSDVRGRMIAYSGMSGYGAAGQLKTWQSAPNENISDCISCGWSGASNALDDDFKFKIKTAVLIERYKI